MTVVVVGTADIPEVAKLSACVRSRGFTVVEIDCMAVIMLVMVTERVVALVVYEQHAPTDWESSRVRLAEISPDTRVVFVRRNDSRTSERLASEVVDDAGQ